MIVRLAATAVALAGTPLTPATWIESVWPVAARAGRVSRNRAGVIGWNPTPDDPHHPVTSTTMSVGTSVKMQTRPPAPTPTVARLARVWLMLWFTLLTFGRGCPQG